MSYEPIKHDWREIRDLDWWQIAGAAALLLAFVLVLWLAERRVTIQRACWQRGGEPVAGAGPWGIVCVQPLKGTPR